MTLITRYDLPASDRILWTINDFAGVYVTNYEAVRAPSPAAFERLVMDRLRPLVWLAMPGHEGTAA